MLFWLQLGCLRCGLETNKGRKMKNFINACRETGENICLIQASQIRHFLLISVFLPIILDVDIGISCHKNKTFLC